MCNCQRIDEVGSIRRTPTGAQIIAADGGVFAYGDAPFYGSEGAAAVTQPVIGLLATPTATGYRLINAAGAAAAYGAD